MKYVYVLTSSEKDFYYEQFFLSLVSLRLYNPEAEIIVLIDEKTKLGLTGKRSEYEKFSPEIIVIKVPADFSQKEASRWIKTSIHHYVPGDFLFIDCDTIICENLSYDFPDNIKIGAVLDTHLTLDKHHLRDNFQKEDIGAGFSSSLNTNIRYNGGLIFCNDDPLALEFFEKWHTLWLESRNRGCSQDMPSLNQANYEMGNVITELNGEWNCQISHNGLAYLSGAKMIHYYATSLVSMEPPYRLASSAILGSIKETGELSDEIIKLLEHPKNAFEPYTRIISDKMVLDALDNSVFFKLIRFNNRHPRFSGKINSVTSNITRMIKKLFR